jgi:crossover junction endodeoxyribonuclease RusA
VSSKTGKGFVREQSAKTLKPWRAAIKEAALLARGESASITGPVRLQVDFFVPRPPSVPEKKRRYPTVAPDLDKMVRAVGDALEEAGVFCNDGQIISLLATKRYATDNPELSPGAWIVVSEVELFYG